VFKKIVKCQISWKSVQWKLSFPMRTNGRTNIVAFDNFANTPKTDILVVNWYITIFESFFFNFILTDVSFGPLLEKSSSSVTGKVRTQHFRMPYAPFVTLKYSFEDMSLLAHLMQSSVTYIYTVNVYMCIYCGPLTDRPAELCRPSYVLHQCFSIFVRPRHGKLFFHKTRARSQTNLLVNTFPFVLSLYIKLT
jgi:hypothetical protein